MTYEHKLAQAKSALGKRYVFSPERREEINKARRENMPVLVLALAARLAGRK